MGKKSKVVIGKRVGETRKEKKLEKKMRAARHINNAALSALHLHTLMFVFTSTFHSLLISKIIYVIVSNW